jgi:ADP-ribose pyrophosphatase YjhB (NUDIX family)
VAFDGHVRFDCPACGWVYYKSPVAAVVGILWTGENVLLTRRARDPGQGLLDLPGGFVDEEETVEHALSREIEEELGMEIPEEAFRYLGSVPNIYPYRGIVYRTADLFFETDLPSIPRQFDTSEIQEIVIQNPGDIDIDSLALQSVRTGVKRWLIGGNPRT